MRRFRRYGCYLLLLSLCLTACSDAACRTTVHVDGSADLAISLSADLSLVTVLEEIGALSQLEDWLRERGFALSWIEHDDSVRLAAVRHLADLGELQQLLPPLPASSDTTAGLEVTRGWLFTCYRWRQQLSLADLLPISAASWWQPVLTALLANSHLTLQVSLPWKAKEHNADYLEDQGRTLCWRLAWSQPRVLEASVCLPSSGWLLAAAGGLILLFYLGWRLWQRRAGE